MSGSFTQFGLLRPDTALPNNFSAYILQTLPLNDHSTMESSSTTFLAISYAPHHFQTTIPSKIGLTKLQNYLFISMKSPSVQIGAHYKIVILYRPRPSSNAPNKATKQTIHGDFVPIRGF